PCSAPTNRHHGVMVFSGGSDSPITAPSAAGICSALDRRADRVVRDQGSGRGGQASSASLVRALSISACCAPDGPALVLLSSDHNVPRRILRTGSLPVRRSAIQATGQPTKSTARSSRALCSASLIAETPDARENASTSCSSPP